MDTMAVQLLEVVSGVCLQTGAGDIWGIVLIL